MIRILCVDDDQLARQFLVTRLAMESDFSLAPPAADIESALEILRAEPIDVVLLDRHLVGATGFDLLERVREDRHRPVLGSPRFLFCTGWGSEDWEAEARGAGAAGVIPKLDAPRDLTGAIRAVAAGGTWFPSAAGPDDRAGCRTRSSSCSSRWPSSCSRPQA